MLLDERALTEAFEQSAAARREKRLMLEEQRQHDDNRRTREERREREEREQRDWDALEQLVLATAAQLAEFHERLDRYQTATVAALMENEAALAEARKRLDEMLARAYVLPDGRRVFKSEDGQRVYDEAGAALGRDVIDPDMIEDSRPSWEAFSAGREEKAQLEQERAGLLRFQERLDTARERVGRNPAAKSDLDALDADLGEAMPDAVRRQLGGGAPGLDEMGAVVEGADRVAVVPGRPGVRVMGSP